MDQINLIKIITAVVTVIVSLIAGIVEIRKNPTFWLNRIFALFFVSGAAGFLTYSLYHIVELVPKEMIIPIMITTHILFNIAFGSLILTVFILEYSEKIAMTSPKYLGISIGLTILSSIGYLIWVPTLNEEEYANGLVDTETPSPWFEIVMIYRLFVIIWILIKFSIIAKRASGDSKKQLTFFAVGMALIELSMIMNLAGVEIFPLIPFCFGMLVILYGFLSVDSKKIK